MPSRRAFKARLICERFDRRFGYMHDFGNGLDPHISDEMHFQKPRGRVRGAHSKHAANAIQWHNGHHPARRRTGIRQMLRLRHTSGRCSPEYRATGDSSDNCCVPADKEVRPRCRHRGFYPDCSTPRQKRRVQDPWLCPSHMHTAWQNDKAQAYSSCKPSQNDLHRAALCWIRGSSFPASVLCEHEPNSIANITILQIFQTFRTEKLKANRQKQARMRDKKQWTMRHIGPNHPSALQIRRTQQRF